MTPAICDELFAAGADVLTTGNHVWDKAEISPYIMKQDRLLRPANMVGISRQRRGLCIICQMANAKGWRCEFDV